MKIYSVFLKDADNPTIFSHLIGTFDSTEAYHLTLLKLQKELNISLNPSDYEVFESELNKNLLL